MPFWIGVGKMYPRMRIIRPFICSMASVINER